MSDRPVHAVHYVPRLRLEEGGVVRSVIDLCAALALAGQRVTLLTHDATDAPVEWSNDAASPRVITIKPTGMMARRPDGAACKAIAEADVVHLHTPWEPGNIALAREARDQGKPYLVSVHGMLDDWSMAQRRAKKEAFLAAVGTRFLEDAAFVHCTAAAELRQAQRTFPQGRGVVAPLVFDLSEYETQPGPEAARQRWPALANGRPTLLFLSRVHYKKGADLLIDIAAALRDRSIDVNVLIAGPGDDDYLATLKNRVRELQLEDRVEFIGLVSGVEKISLYEAADVFVLPTSQENFGFVFFESLAAGTPVVTTTGVDTWPELEESGGAMITPRTVETMTEVIAELLQDGDRLRVMGERGRAWTLDRFRGQRVVEEYVDLYRQAITEQPAVQPVTMELLRRVARKGGAASKDDPFWVSKYFYRHITIYFTWVCAKLGLSANGVTLASAIAVFAGAICFGLPSRWTWLAGALLVQLYFILDHVDGEMARFERAVKRRSSGMAGVFYDTVCHAGETAVMAAIALRLFADLGGPWWVMVTLIVALFPGGIDPWQRYSESVLAHGERTAKDGKITLDARFVEKSSIGMSSGTGTPSWRRAIGLISQTIGFPGYFVTLLAAAVLDLFPALQIEIGGQPLPYLFLWLLIRALHKSAAALKSTFVYGRRLRGLG